MKDSRNPTLAVQGGLWLESRGQTLVGAKRIELLEVRRLPPRKIDADERDVLERGQNVVEDDYGVPIGRYVEVMRRPIVFKVV